MGEEYKIFDSQGRVAKVVKEGRKLNDVSWDACRILLSNKRFIIAKQDSKRTIALSEVNSVGGRKDVSQVIASVSNYLTLHLESKDVIVLNATSSDELKVSFFEAVLDSKVVYTKHPAVEGGVITDSNWEKARLNIEEKQLSLATKSGSLIDVNFEEVSDLENLERTIKGKKRDVLSVSHAEGSTSVETYITSSDKRIGFINDFLQEAKQKNTADNMEFTEEEEEVLMGLYSGVSPFEIPNFSDLETEKVEQIYLDLIDKDVVDLVRERKEVTLTSRGRNLASEAMNEQ